MSKTALHILILNWLKFEKRGQWVAKSDVELFGRSCGTMGTTAVRRLLEMRQPTHRNYNPNIKHEIRKGVAFFSFQEQEKLNFMNGNKMVGYRGQSITYGFRYINK